MRRLVLLTLLVLAAPSAAARDRAEEDYQAARRAYYQLKDDAQRRKFRHQWLNVAHRFEAVAKKYPNSGRAPDALYTAARLLAELSRISMLDEDLRAAISDYETILERTPKNSLADDAALALGRIYLERTGETEKSRRVVERALTALPRGDQRAELVALRALLPASPQPPATGKRVPARHAAAKEDAQARSGTAQKSSAANLPSDSSKSSPSTRTRKSAPASPSSPSAAETASTGALLDAIARTAKIPSSSPGSAPRAAAPSAKSSTPVRSERPGRGAASDHADDAPGSVSSPSTDSVVPDPEGAHAEAEEEDSAPDAPPATPTKAQARLRAALDAGTSEVTLAEQLGLKVRRVVIDAGHGGHDTGAIGRRGTQEKDVTLAVARKVAEILADRGLEVILTRDDDRFVRLEDRTRIANEAKGDLFISIHCNAAANRRIRGIETFTLNVASDRYSIRLAARENAQSEKSLSDLQFILADLATRANTEESERLARRVQKSLVGTLARKYSEIEDHGTKHALFYVLLGAKMPAILVESSFLSHPEEEVRLASKAYQSHLAEAIADGVQAFLDDRHRVAQVE
ncbi:MAG TPA: N-acetylmuramoyl-L-alanine amidase [Myxococcaceae bacterium]|nr:N-acetylmuramoyl-L-alanine amidase [Myxococcaceae bacterium]